MVQMDTDAEKRLTKTTVLLNRAWAGVHVGLGEGNTLKRKPSALTEVLLLLLFYDSKVGLTRSP